MAEFRPLPLRLHLKRILLELQRQSAVYDLPVRKFYSGSQAVDLSVLFHGRPASTPLGPAAGPHNQLVQNIVLAWLAGSRIIELKTVQVLDALDISRPCIDMQNVGFNVEWSQELRVSQSLREYVTAWMLIRILRETPVWEILEKAGGDTIFDMSVGYDLKGINTPKVRRFIDGMLDASAVIDELRMELDGPFRRFRDLDFDPRVSSSVTLSTFHGCPATEIEGIAHTLLTDVGTDTIVKFNPTLLGYERVRQILHDGLGYTGIELDPHAFQSDLRWEQAVEIVRTLQKTARQHGRGFGIKLTNTLVVQNHKTFFPAKERVMYLSGQPLHVLATQLLGEFRREFGGELEISFSAGVDNQNFPRTLALGLLPVTTCTDLLRPGGYGRLPRYLKRLETRMTQLGVRTVEDYVILSEGCGLEALERACHCLEESFRSGNLLEKEAVELARLEAAAGNWRLDLLEALKQRGALSVFQALEEGIAAAGARDSGTERSSARFSALAAKIYRLCLYEARVLNTEKILPELVVDPRYSAAKNRALPKKIGSKLFLWDCINCDKCIPVCPNDANFAFTVREIDVSFESYAVQGPDLVAVPRGRFKVEKSHQIANYADFCNECGNCDIFCPEDGGPYLEKPRIFSSPESLHQWSEHDGFALAVEGPRRTIFGRISGQEIQLVWNMESGVSTFSDGVVEVDLLEEEHRVIAKRIVGIPLDEHILEMKGYFVLSILLHGLLAPERVHFANLPFLPEPTV